MLRIDAGIEALVGDGQVGAGIEALIDVGLFNDKQVMRAVEQGLDDTAFDVEAELVSEMKRVFDNPTKFTLNSLKVNKTKNHNMEASVWLREPSRMKDHYLLPTIDGGQRKLKGFERAIGDVKFYPARGARLNKFGNVSQGLIKQIMSVLGVASAPGYSANVTAKSAVTNKGSRDFVYLPKGAGKLPPGIYERLADKRKGLRKKDRSAKGRRYDQIQRRKRGGYGRGRRLKPIMFEDKQQRKYTARFDFWGVAERVASERLPHHVAKHLAKQAGGIK